MKCQKCGAEIPDGKLYCEKCGTEVHIVPDFEPEIENSMHESLTGIVEKTIGEPLERPPKSQKKKIIFVIAAGIVLLLLIAGVISFLICTHSYTYQIKKAKTCEQNQKPEEAILYYEKAVSMNSSDIAVQLSLSDVYYEAGYYEKYEGILLKISKSAYASPDEVISAYKKLVNFYKDNGDYETINSLLLQSDNDEVKNLFQTYMAQPPEFSYKGGNYAQVIPLKLTSSTQGTIYYTLDGMMPDENSEIYTTPIFLDTGNYTVTAIFVNEYGVKSDVVSQNYDIDVMKPAAPEVNTYSGDYTVPTMIEVAEPQEGMVYYTTDGSEPSLESSIYTGPIPMPLGHSVFHFAILNEDNVFSESTVREYELTLQTSLTPEDARNGLLNILSESGKVVENDGSIKAEDLNGRYLYIYQYALSIPDEGDFYVIAEIFEDSAGIQSKTGTVYAVNIYTNEYFKMSRGALDEFILEPCR